MLFRNSLLIILLLFQILYDRNPIIVNAIVEAEERNEKETKTIISSDDSGGDDDAVCKNAVGDGGNSKSCQNNQADKEEDNTQKQQQKQWIKAVDKDGNEIIGCNRLNEEGPRRIFDQSTWHELREIYRDVVGDKNSTILPVYNEEDDEEEYDYHFYWKDEGFFVPYEVNHTPDGRGRGVYATEDIPNGTVVFRSLFLAKFTSEESFRMYLSKLSFELACDVIAWAYPSISENYIWTHDNTKTKKEHQEQEQDEDEGDDEDEEEDADEEEEEEEDDEENENEEEDKDWEKDKDPSRSYKLVGITPTVQLDLDDGSFVNHGSSSSSSSDNNNDDDNNNNKLIENIGCYDKEYDCLSEYELKNEEEIPYQYNIVALRDIKEGEEILTDYQGFFKPGIVPWFDLIWKDAWEDSNFGVGLDMTKTIFIEDKKSENNNNVGKEEEMEKLT